MEIVDKIMGKVDQWAELFMPDPVGEIDDNDPGTVVGRQQAQPQRAEVAQEDAGEVLRVANGGTEMAYGGSASSASQADGFVRGRTLRRNGGGPQLTVHTTKVGHLDVNVYAPTAFAQVQQVADDLKAGRAAVVNYERLAVSEQCRICDFINGAAYVLDATPRRVSAQIMIYVPRGVDIETLRARMGSVLPD